MSSNAEIWAYLDKFFFMAYEEKVPIQPLSSSPLICQVTNKGDSVSGIVSGNLGFYYFFKTA